MAENRKKFGFNIVDVVIILVLAFALSIFSYYAMGKWAANESSGSVLQYTVEVVDVTHELATSFKAGDEVKDVRKGTNIGKITAVSEPLTFRTITENKNEGVFQFAEIPDRYQTSITIETSYKDSDKGYFVDDVEIKVGKSITLKTNTAAADSVILKVDKKGGVK